MTTKDPYVYFRVEARELLDGLVKGVLELEKGPVGKDAMARLLRLAHTLKGAARVVKQPVIADLSHAIEDRLAPLRDGGTSDQARVDELLRMLDGIGAALKALDGGATPEPAQSKPPAEAQLETVRVDLAEMEALLQGVSETAVQLTAVRQHQIQLDRCRTLAAHLIQQLQAQTPARSLAEELIGTVDRLQRGLVDGIEQVERELLQVRDRADRMRLVPVRVMFATLERAVRDAARAVDRRVELRVSGGDSRIDAHVLSKLSEALLHVVRNAVAHGIESDTDRRKAGKPPIGAIEIAVERRGGQIVFNCRDDGRGIDVEAVRAVAIRRGLVPAGNARSLDLDQAVQLLLRGGVSTTAVANQTSGRGIGLDVVRAVAAELKGEVTVRSVPGRGTTVELSVPPSLSSVNAVSVEASGMTFSIPVDALAGIIRFDQSTLSRSEARESIMHEGRAIPFMSLGRVVRPNGQERMRHSSVVIARSDALLTAVGVERVLGTAELVVRPLPTMMVADPIVAGASFDAEGNPCLLLDPAGIARAARQQRVLFPEVPAAPPVVLVIDDSLTTRMLEQSILEAAGYEVDVATSAEEGIEKARGRRYHLFLVDVEMPGMDGFEFVARTRTDPVLRDTPAILVTSRAAPEDKRRGEQVGARGYMVKSEFDQARLLETIRGLIG